MANRTLTADVIASEAVMLLENNLVMGNLIYRAEDDYAGTVNGYRKGDTINFRKPAQFEIREGAVAQPQDVVEGKMPIVVDTQVGVDVAFTSKDLTLSIQDMSQRFVKPAMIKLGNYVDQAIMNLYKQVPSWVGTPGQTINSFADFAVGTQRMDDKSIPTDDRACVLSPADFWGMTSSQTALFIQDAGAIRFSLLFASFHWASLNRVAPIRRCGFWRQRALTRATTLGQSARARLPTC